MIAIIAAMSEEVSAIVSRMNEVEKKVIYQAIFYQGTLADCDVVIMQSGVGKVAAAMSTTQLFEHFEIDGVINIGTAGGLVENQKVLDIVISSKVAFHDIDVPSVNWVRNFDNEKICFSSDSDYVDAMKKVICENDDRVWIGPMVSGDCFVCRKDQVDTIKRYFPQALCAEMEAAAIAWVCKSYLKPFVVIRSLSDITLQEDNNLTFDEYLLKASERSALWCEKAIPVLSKRTVH